MQRNNLPLFFMLIAGAITCVLTLVNGYTLNEMLIRLLVVLIVFYFLGSLLRGCLDMFEKQNREAQEALTKAQEEALKAIEEAQKKEEVREKESDEDTTAGRE
ncbi:MAG: hypothetical protein IJ335_02215 [Lachnospiraceae bacterium]|nr:hypothetical protein [Lachnospiraceae bacterium]